MKIPQAEENLRDYNVHSHWEKLKTCLHAAHHFYWQCADQVSNESHIEDILWLAITNSIFEHFNNKFR